MRHLLIVTFSVFVVCPAFGQYVDGEAGVTLPLGEFSYAKTGFQAGLTARLPVLDSDVDVSSALRISYNVNPIPQGEIRRVTGLLGPEVTYTRRGGFTRVQLGGGISFAPWGRDKTAWMGRFRLGFGIETENGQQLSLGPLYATTLHDQSWWGITAAFSF